MKRSREAGFSLIEVIVALGLLGGILLSVAGMFLLGERQVMRGRNQSYALSISRTILEEVGGWSHEATWERFGMTGTNATQTIDTQTNSFATKWQPLLDETLHTAAAEIRVESCDGSSLDTAPALRVIVRVWWDERTERRDVELSLVRL